MRTVFEFNLCASASIAYAFTNVPMFAAQTGLTFSGPWRPEERKNVNLVYRAVGAVDLARYNRQVAYYSAERVYCSTAVVHGVTAVDGRDDDEAFENEKGVQT